MQTTAGRIISVILAIAFLAALARLAREQNGGPPHFDFELPGAEPATLYLPGSGDFFENLAMFPRPPAERPPAVVLAHGYSADRVAMSRLARRFAQNGYAVLAIDFHGHGANRNPFANSLAEPDVLHEDLKAALDYLRGSQLVDASRIVVMGHSMGAAASLEYATTDTGQAGSVMISGGWSLFGPERPRNALFIFAEHDPQLIRDSSIAIASHLAGVDHIELGKLYGDLSTGTAVEAVRIPGVDHIEIIASDRAAKTIIAWLDGVTGFKRNGEINLVDPRRRTSGIALLLFVLLLVPLGRMCGSLSPAWERRSAGGAGWIGETVLAIALVAAMPLVTATRPAEFLSTQIANEVFSFLGAAGVLMALGLALGKSVEGQRLRQGIGATLSVAALAFALIYVMMVPMSVTVHRLVPTPERLIAIVIASIVLLPFFLSFELLVRRGGVAMSTTLGVIGRALTVVLLGVSIRSIFPPLASLMMMPLFVIFVLFEVFAASVYSASGNLALIAAVESTWLAWLLCALMPITIKI